MRSVHTSTSGGTRGPHELALLPPSVSADVRASLWVGIAFVVVAVATAWAVHSLMPWVVETLTPVVVGIVTVAGVVLAVPDYLVTSLLRQQHRPVPHLVYRYGDVVETGVLVAQRAARHAASTVGHLRRTPKLAVAAAIALALLAVTGRTPTPDAGHPGDGLPTVTAPGAPQPFGQ